MWISVDSCSAEPSLLDSARSHRFVPLAANELLFFNFAKEISALSRACAIALGQRAPLWGHHGIYVIQIIDNLKRECPLLRA
jgi:hypothetical protein